MHYHIPYLEIIGPKIPKNLTFDAFSDSFWNDLVCIAREEARHLYLVSGVPQFVTINKDKHRYKFPGEAAYIYWLFHWRQPSQTVIRDEDTFGFDSSTLCKVWLST